MNGRKRVKIVGKDVDNILVMVPIGVSSKNSFLPSKLGLAAAKRQVDRTQ